MGTGTIPRLLWMPSILFNPFRWFFPSLQVVSSHTWLIRTLLNTWGDPLQICGILSVWFFSPVVCTVNSRCLCLPTFSATKPSSTQLPPCIGAWKLSRLFMRQLEGLPCLFPDSQRSLSLAAWFLLFFFFNLKTTIHVFFSILSFGFFGGFLVISSKRVDSIPGTSSCPEAKVYTVHLKFFVFMN